MDFRRILAVFKKIAWNFNNFFAGFWGPKQTRSICETFRVEGLALMIRATRGRSME